MKITYYPHFGQNPEAFANVSKFIYQLLNNPARYRLLEDAVAKGDISQIESTVVPAFTIYKQYEKFKSALDVGDVSTIDHIMGGQSIEDSKYFIKLSHKHGQTPMIQACKEGRFDIARVLVKASYALEQEVFSQLIFDEDCFNRNMPLFNIIQSNNTETMDLIITRAKELGWDTIKTLLKANNHPSGNVFHIASGFGSIKLLNKFLEMAKEIGNGFVQELLLSKTWEGDTPISLAVVKNKKESLELLLNTAQEIEMCTLDKLITAKGPDGKTLLEEAQHCKNDKIIEIIERAKASVESDYWWDDKVELNSQEAMVSQNTEQDHEPMDLSGQDELFHYNNNFT